MYSCVYCTIRVATCTCSTHTQVVYMYMYMYVCIVHVQNSFSFSFLYRIAGYFRRVLDFVTFVGELNLPKIKPNEKIPRVNFGHVLTQYSLDRLNKQLK